MVPHSCCTSRDTSFNSRVRRLIFPCVPIAGQILMSNHLPLCCLSNCGGVPDRITSSISPVCTVKPVGIPGSSRNRPEPPGHITSGYTRQPGHGIVILDNSCIPADQYQRIGCCREERFLSCSLSLSNSSTRCLLTAISMLARACAHSKGLKR